jgi:hypothetical protein
LCFIVGKIIGTVDFRFQKNATPQCTRKSGGRYGVLPYQEIHEGSFCSFRINPQTLTDRPSSNAFARVHGCGSQSPVVSPSAKAVRDCLDSHKSYLPFG